MHRVCYYYFCCHCYYSFTSAPCSRFHVFFNIYIPCWLFFLKKIFACVKLPTCNRIFFPGSPNIIHFKMTISILISYVGPSQSSPFDNFLYNYYLDPAVQLSTLCSLVCANVVCSADMKTSWQMGGNVFLLYCMFYSL